MDGVFLDANVLFSAAYELEEYMRNLWKLTDVELLTSLYALQEAQRNLAKKNPAALSRLHDLAARLNLCLWQGAQMEQPKGFELVEKDLPILAAAMHVRSSHLLTGDKHFDKLFGHTIEGVLILRPAQYLRYKLENA